jgi:hypothetical protein
VGDATRRVSAFAREIQLTIGCTVKLGAVAIRKLAHGGGAFADAQLDDVAVTQAITDGQGVGNVRVQAV